MKGVKRTNAEIVHHNQRAEFAQHNPYAMNMDYRNLNCYNCGGFGYLARNCRNRGIGNRIGEGRKLEYKERRITEGGNGQNRNLNGDENLIVLN